MTEPYKKKLIEVALPLDAINKEAAREKSIRHGHPSTLHLWWARRPLAACRAVLFAQLVDDPSAHPDEFPSEEAQALERQRLFDIIEQLVKWENSNNEKVLEMAREEIRRSCGGNPPPILDPFAGGGSIPLEAQRLGLEAHASDLNPVAVLINKALIEIPPQWAGRPPVHPREGTLQNETWERAQGLAQDVRYYGQWMRDEAERRIGHLYPKAKLPDGSEANVIAWIWTRTVTCPNPACQATMPLASSLWLGKKKGKERWVRPLVEGKVVRFEIGEGPVGPPDPPKTGRGAKFRCLACGEQAADAHIKAEGMAGRMGAQLMAVVAEGNRQRVYLPPSDAHVNAAEVERPADVPDTELVDDPRAIWCRLYGLLTHADLFTNRQLVALTTFSDLIGEARAKVGSDAITAGFAEIDATRYASAVATYLGLTLDKMVDRNSALCAWEPKKDRLRGTFQRQALPMAWDFTEANCFGSAGGDFATCVFSLWEVVERLRADQPPGFATHEDASVASVVDGVSVITTDPPYYDNIGYANLADFFYVWLRRSLRDVHPELLATMLTPKAEELVATPYRFDGSKARAKAFFEDGFVRTFTSARTCHAPNVPMTIFYAFKQTEGVDDSGLASTGWETMLEGLLKAGLAVTATWPMRTELANRMLASGTNALASSIVLACRPRAETAGVTDRRGFIKALKDELPAELRVLQQGSIQPVDLAQAAIGPGMAVFSRYAQVIEPETGKPMRVRAALGLINQVLSEVLSEQEDAFDPETRWAIKWFEQHGFDEGKYGDAELLATATATAVRSMEESGILAARAGKVHLLERKDMPEHWDPTKDIRTPVWEVTQHLIKRLDSHGEAAAADLLAQVGGLGEAARDLAYRLYDICDKKGWAQDALAFNTLVASWPELARLAQSTDRLEEQRTML